MHESVVTLQNLIATNRANIGAMTQTLDQAATQGIALIDGAHLEAEIHVQAKRCDELEDLVNDYIDAERNQRPAEAAHNLVLIQLAAATMIETRNLEAAHGLN